MGNSVLGGASIDLGETWALGRLLDVTWATLPFCRWWPSSRPPTLPPHFRLIFKVPEPAPELGGLLSPGYKARSSPSPKCLLELSGISAFRLPIMLRIRDLYGSPLCPAADIYIPYTLFRAESRLSTPRCVFCEMAHCLYSRTPLSWTTKIRRICPGQRGICGSGGPLV